MIEKARYFIPDVAVAKLLELAIAKGFNVGNGTDLAKQRILLCAHENAPKYLNGVYPITRAHELHIRNKLDIGEDLWDRITEWRPTNQPKLVAAFFSELKVRGLASVLAFSPRQSEHADLDTYCVPARVVPEEEWSYLTQRRRGSTQVPEGREEDLLARGAVGVLLNGWLRRAFRRVVIQGEPGEGKTTALWLYVGEVCRQWLSAMPKAASLKSKTPLLVPLVLPLKRVPEVAAVGADLVELAIQETLSLACIDADLVRAMKDWLRQKAEQGKFVLLLDGLDELPPTRSDWLRTELLRWNTAPVVLTSRYHAEPGQVLRGYTTLRMIPLRWWVIDQFITRYFAGQRGGVRLANELRNTLRLAPGLRQLGQNPLLLAATCFLKAEDHSAVLPATRTGLIHAALRTLLRRGDSRRANGGHRTLRDEQKIGVLAEAAWYFQRERSWPMTELGLLKVLDRARSQITDDPPIDAETLLGEFVLDGVLVRRGSGPYDFLLRRFQEYCAARRLAAMAESGGEWASNFAARVRGRAEEWGRGGRWSGFRPLNQTGWVEIWPMVAGCLGENPILIQALHEEWKQHEDLVRSRLALLVDALGEFLALNQGNRSVLNQWQALAGTVAEVLLGEVVDEPLMGGLPESWRRRLARLPGDFVVPRLWARIEKEYHDRQAAGSYALALGEVGTREARQWLAAVLEDEAAEESLRASAATALGWVGDAEARDALLWWLKDSAARRQILRFGCIAGLSYVGDERSRQALSELIAEAGNAEARHQCLDACERLFGPEIEKQVLALLSGLARQWPKVTGETDEADQTMQQCAGILGRIGSPTTADRLVKLLDLPLSTHVKNRLCAAIAETGDEESRRKLRKFVLNPQADPALVAAAVPALIRVGDEEMLPKILEVCADPRCAPDIRQAATEACAVCAILSAIRFLADRLENDPADQVKLEAARGLAQQGDPLAVRALKKAAARSAPGDLQNECLRGLALAGDHEAQEKLIRCVEDAEGDFRTRCVAIHTLAQCAGEGPRTALRRLHDDLGELPPLRLRCRDALALIQRTQGWRPLEAGGWEAP